jgi:hypothetical protein
MALRKTQGSHDRRQTRTDCVLLSFVTLQFIEAEPTTPDQRGANAQYYLRVLHRLIELGASLAERIQQQPVNHAEATAAGIELSAEPASVVSIEFDRTVRGVRRSILLAQHIQDPAPARAAADPVQHRSLVRQRILRVVEDEIHDKFHGEAADALRRELVERLESPELQYEIDTRAADEIIVDIRHDLDTAGLPGYHHPWKRRTPDDVADLHALAAGRPAGLHRSRPPTSPLRERPTLPANDGEAVAMLLQGDGRLPAT